MITDLQLHISTGFTLFKVKQCDTSQCHTALCIRVEKGLIFRRDIWTDATVLLVLITHTEAGKKHDRCSLLDLGDSLDKAEVHNKSSLECFTGALGKD